MTPGSRHERALGRSDRRFVFSVLLGGLVLCGVLSRVVPLLDRGGRLLQQFPSEDGYLMLTVARNIAIGNGMSTAAGTIPTNGTQPFVTFLWAFGFWTVDGDRKGGVTFALLVQLAVAVLAGFSLFSLGRRLLARRDDGWGISALAASVWFATMLTVMHGMNCLETGMYALVVILFALAFISRQGDPTRPWSVRRSVALGALLGLAFWVRVDAVLLAAAACFSRAALRDGGRFGLARSNLHASLTMGTTALLVASPWLLYSLVRFGSVIPISGTAQRWDARFGQNLVHVMAHLAEYILVVTPIPQPLETRLPTVIFCGLLITACAAVVARIWTRSGPCVRAFLALTCSYGFALSAYYGLAFGAPYFVSRYLFPLSPFLALLWATIAFTAWQRLPFAHARSIAAVGSAALLALVLAPNVRLYGRGAHHMHFQVVEWVNENVPDDVWVGAVQSGTLGFFHDRTINLDGKVNPEALDAVLARTIPEYVLSKPIRYIVDWCSMASWARIDLVRRHFDLIVEDHERNLAVLARVDRTSSTPSPCRIGNVCSF